MKAWVTTVLHACQAHTQMIQKDARMAYSRCARSMIGTVGSLTRKLEAGSAAEDGPPCGISGALVHPGVLVLVQVANDQVAPRHVTPVVIPQINECSV